VTRITTIADKVRQRARLTSKPWGLLARVVDYTTSFVIHFNSEKLINKAYHDYLMGADTPRNVDELVIGSNFLSKGKKRHQLVDSAGFSFQEESIEPLHTILPLFDVDSCVAELKTEGFTRIPVELPANFVNELVELALISKVKPTKYAKVQGLQDRPTPEIDHIWDVPFEDSISCSSTQLLIQDRQLLTVAGKYLQANPVVIGSRLYWSLAHEREEFQTAENWHVDAGDGLRFVKLFVALTEVTAENGPTGFIKGSHVSLPRKFYSGRRFHPKEIEQRFPGKLMEATGSKGTIYLVDTRGLHRGTPVKEGRRLLLHFFYGTDFFGFPRPTVAGLDSSVCFGDKYKGELKRTFAAFRSDAPSNTAEIKGP
jgi:hypothetical protein